MILRAVLRRRAVEDLNEIYRWYENEHQGLGHEFLDIFKEIVMSIEEFPQSYTRIEDKVRRATMARFPYHVFYQIEAKRIVVLAVVHSARHPSTWPQSRKRTH